MKDQKTKTLIVNYLPRGERSSTKKLVDAFVSGIKDNESKDIEILDLLKNTPDFLTAEIVDAYIHRNYLGEKLDEKKQKLLSKMDNMTEQLKGADVVVIAFPMYNLSMPAMVKAYFDSVMQKGVTWDAKDGYVGLMKGKKALILTSSGGVYPSDSPSEHSVSLAKAEFAFMGFSDIRVVAAQGVNAPHFKKEDVLAEAEKGIKKIVSEWY
jgi:FMN-dependent NADH-azoreductase